MNTILHQLKNNGLVWQGATRMPQRPSTPTAPEDYLATHIPGGLTDHPAVEIGSPAGIGELRLLLPKLRANAEDNNRLLVWIGPPHKPNAEALHHAGVALSRVLILHPKTAKHALWAAEQCLGSGACHSVLLWHSRLNVAQLQRLQQAAGRGQAQLFWLHDQHSLNPALPISLSMDLQPHPEGLQITVRKCRGSWPPAPFIIDMRQHWPKLTLTDPVASSQNLIIFPGSRAS
ncbi:translesion DNA synthesis-associated protein ImuA [Lacimicrobium sp. SS2-24]|uniref:translesion DNA synthesis-associated protein ImuA n=1 Tax=Lacimicrobium sp. SS2-24 TaxID=2005569 RepID=UPI001130B20D|nr:translesion DNA synthesis-associated protein ImuA [Lacimicrobium sp. SS2-24]